MDIILQRAGINDLDLLIKWRMEVLREVFSLPPDAPTDRLESENRSYYQRELPTGGHIACFARIGGEIVGCGGICIYSEMPSPDNPAGRCAYLMNVYTRAAYRGRGVGEETVRWLTGQAKERHITKIYLEASQSGRSLYRKACFEELHGYMILNEKAEHSADRPEKCGFSTTGK